MKIVTSFFTIIKSKIRPNHKQRLLKAVSRFLPANPIILEAGAYDGTDTIMMARNWPKATIYAFEPITSLYSKCREKTKEYPNVILRKLALSNKNGYSQINVSRGMSDASSSLLQPKDHLSVHPDTYFTKIQKVNTITINSYCKQNNIDHIDFLWLDLQGMELPVLKSAAALLYKVRVIYTEVSFIENYLGCCLYPEVKNFLISQGFKVYREYFYWHDSGDVMFVKDNNNE